MVDARRVLIFLAIVLGGSAVVAAGVYHPVPVVVVLVGGALYCIWRATEGL
jgi:predicted transcriptional regulator